MMAQRALEAQNTPCMRESWLFISVLCMLVEWEGNIYVVGARCFFR